MTSLEHSNALSANKYDAPADAILTARLLSQLSSEALDELAEALTPRISAILARQVNQRRYGA